MSKSPTQRTLEEMRNRGYLCWIVEHWNHFARKRQDLFGFVDVLAIKEGETIAIQTTSANNVSARVSKIAEHENVGQVRKAGWKILVHGWNGSKLREVDCS